MNGRTPEARPWKRLVTLTLWLFLMPPVGLWKLYQDDALSPSAKWRVLIYLGVLPALIYIAVSTWVASTALQKLLP